MARRHVGTASVAAQRLTRHALGALIALVAVTGCGPMFGLREDLEEAEQELREIDGTIAAPSDTDPIVLLVLQSPEADEATRVFSGTLAGNFTAYVPRRPLYLFAFADHNQNLGLDEGEANGWYDAGRPLPAGTNHFALVLQAAPAQPVPAALRDGRSAHWTQFAGMQINSGTVTLLTDPRFSREQATLGLWQPFEFMKAGGTGIHFLAPYSASLEPVLFIHGIDDTPRSFG